MRMVKIKISGKSIQAQEGQTIIQALWSVGRASEIQTGCLGGVCGACTVTIRYGDGRKAGTDLACLRVVEEGMEVFPYPIETLETVAPISNLSIKKLKQSFPTLDSCTKCGSCTTSCPMDIPVMDSVLRMQKGEFDAVVEDFTTCIHCGFCRFVCEDGVKPHNMGLFLRRSAGIDSHYPRLEVLTHEKSSKEEDREWEYLQGGGPEEMLERAREFRRQGKIPE